ncbi:cAMP-binding proteins - catabolite gene activator and regulatory subunit of cAMP-dependent protein kinases [Rhodovastum atsumiense]|uniref:Crp/Fnr family transcriptional regulator n=1 Tax=Rhodovastum atsumiense TaxID=504468 RepID=A0A5M6J304_9PROT|nr:Crp/Fnr family transcriptional regulator [Rhodovastum atsumiense]KAA5614619.1 Crp/Fnr family transcriptional regulator [Rhodovastum atsumiense]CAH2599872.1 cAMP-binding proteins - catabolite gene activator and regulatory subunit of cAMP-dependent protein kinases [Rhodovastum atsumiense]
MGFCASLGTHEITEFAALRKAHRHFPGGHELYVQGEKCPSYFIVLDGWVGLRVVLENGSGHMPDVALRGGLLGACPGPDSVMSHTACCLGPVSACIVSREALDGAAAADPRIARRLTELMACREGRITSHFASATGRSARERIACLLFELFYRVTGRTPLHPGEAIEIPLTLSHIAEATGLTAVHVNRMVRQLREQQVLHFIRHRLQVLDPAAFARVAQFDTDPAYFLDEGLRPEAGMDLARPGFTGMAQPPRHWLGQDEVMPAAGR